VIEPEVVIISAGLENQYGHPHQKVIDRIAEIGASIVYTDTTQNDETVLMTSDCDSYEFSSGAAAAQKTTQSPTSTAPEPTMTPNDQPTATVSESCSGASAEIIGLDKNGKPEVVTISGNGDLSGWYIVSVRGTQRYEFPSGFMLNTVVEVQSFTPQFEDSPSKLFWSSSPFGTTARTTMPSFTTATASLYTALMTASNGRFEQGITRHAGA